MQQPMDDSWVRVSEFANIEVFLQDLFLGVPFCLKLQAMLDWHANPVTSVLVTQYVSPCEDCRHQVSLSCLFLAAWLQFVALCRALLWMHRDQVLVTGDAAGNVIEWKRGEQRGQEP